MESAQMTRARKAPGRIAFVGSGPGDTGLLTVRANELITHAELVVTDPDVPSAVLALIGEEVELRPAVGDPADVAKDLVNEAKAGRSVVRLVAGDPLTLDAVVREAQAVAKSTIAFDVVPGVPGGTAVPAYAGVALGAVHTEVDVRGEIDWAGLAAAPGTLVLHATGGHLAEAASCLVENGMASATAVAVTADGTGNGQRTVDTTLASLAADAGELVGNLIVTVGAAAGNRSKLSWWESRSLYGWKVLVPQDQGPGVRDEREAALARRHPGRGADHLGRAAAQPRPDGALGQGPCRRPLPVGRVHLDERCSRGLGEVPRVRPGRAGVLRREDRLRR